jgi:1-acyl-sn-glycerol-3-phosphate acyltransferase
MSVIKGLLALTVVVLNSIILVPVLLLFSVFKLLIPLVFIRNIFSKLIVKVAELWISINTVLYDLINGEKLEIHGLQGLQKNDWYLVVSNHASAADIPIIQKTFNRKIPFLKFFLKQQLIWVPFLGLAWWALDFPFMKRFSRDYIQKNPEKRGQDLEITKKACEKFKQFPISVINFIEGTRFTQTKHDLQESPYNYLLKPKAGGLGFVLGSMGNQLNNLLLVNVKYLPRAPSMWEYLSGKFDKVIVKIEKIKIPENLKNRNYITDKKYRNELQLWVNNLWQQQDKSLS